jgi:hypothetical protein
LQYKIIVSVVTYVQAYPDVFELGQCEYKTAIDSLLDHVLVGNVGQSEMVTVSRNALFLAVFDICCGFNLFRDQKDPSSVTNNRPDDTLMNKAALLAKNEAKPDVTHEEEAEKELTCKFGRDAVKVFPRGRNSVFGMTTFPQRINIFEIKFDPLSSSFSTELLISFDMRHLQQRVEFVQTVFKMAQWMASVEGPNVGFHLPLGVRIRTTNSHHVTWQEGVIIKELKLTRDTATMRENRAAQMRRIRQVYEARLPNVEWGEVLEPSTLRIERLGMRLRDALAAKLITKDKAIKDVTAGELVYFICKQN